MRSLSDPIVSTHLFFIFNVLLYLYSGFFFLGLVLFVCTLASFMYHWSAETNKKWKIADRLLCIVSLIFIFGYLKFYSSSFEIIACLIWLAFSLWVYSQSRIDYQFFHTLWHTCVFLGNVLVWICLI